MHILTINDLKNFNFCHSAVALGSFEALHSGHLKIIEKTVKCAKEKHLQSLITIFREPILKNRDLVCETLEERLNILNNLDVDIVVVFDFNDEFSSIEYLDFFKTYLLNIFKATHIFTGFNYRFGNKAIGNTEKLKLLCDKENIVLDITPPIASDEVISSTYIYSLINKGDVKKLRQSLQRPYSISGKVISGRKIGDKIGFPTANILYPDNKAIIKDGVYLGTVSSDYGTNYALINVGMQPTVSEEHTPRVEAHILDFKENLYNCQIKLNFLTRIRDICKFSNINELKEQLKKDKKYAEKIIKANTK